MDFVILNRAFYSSSSDSDKIGYPNGAFFGNESQESLRIPGCQWTFRRQTDELMRPLRELQVDMTELALFKAVLFFNRGTCREWELGK